MMKLIIFVAALSMCLVGSVCADVTNWVIVCCAGAGNIGASPMYCAVNNVSGVRSGASDGLGHDDSFGFQILPTMAYVRDYSYGITSGGYGICSNLKAPFTSGNKEWTFLLGCMSEYAQSILYLRFWAVNMSYDCPSISVQITRGLPGTNFTTGTILISNWDKSDLGTKTDPAYYFDMSEIIPQLVAGSTIELTMTATAVPEPGSITCVFGGIAGLIALAIRRRL